LPRELDIRFDEMLGRVIGPGGQLVIEHDAEGRAIVGNFPATVPGLLEKHFARLRQADESDGGSGAWVDVFCRDMQGLLLAELDIRLQPIEGLLDALRKS